MDDIKLFVKNNEKEMETLIQTIRMYIQDIGMEFGIEKDTMLMIRSGERQITEGIGLANQERIKTLGRKKNYKYLGILEADTTKEAEMKEKE